MAILEVANVLEDPSVRAREARIIMLRERAIVFSRVLEYFLKQGNGNCDTMARSNGLVVNAQIIESSRGLSQLWPDISIHLRTNRVSSLSNRPPNRRASLSGHVLGLEIVGTRSDPTPAKEIAFWRFCRLTSACSAAPQSKVA